MREICPTTFAREMIPPDNHLTVFVCKWEWGMSRTALKIDWVKVMLEKMDTQMDTAPPPICMGKGKIHASLCAANTGSVLPTTGVRRSLNKGFSRNNQKKSSVVLKK